VLLLFASLATAAVYLLIVRFGLARMVRFIPFQVMAGFLASTGWLMASGALNIMAGVSLTRAGLDAMFAHGGLFATKGVAQRFLAAAIDTPVSVGASASEGGAWGIAVLAAYLLRRTPEQSLSDYLTSAVFADAELAEVTPDPADVAGFDIFVQRYVRALPVQQAAVQSS